MNSTCRGEGEGLNCKTRRQRSCALKACRDQAVLWGGVCTLGTASSQEVERETTRSPGVQRDGQESNQLKGHGRAEMVARTKEHTDTEK